MLAFVEPLTELSVRQKLSSFGSTLHIISYRHHIGIATQDRAALMQRRTACAHHKSSHEVGMDRRPHDRPAAAPLGADCRNGAYLDKRFARAAGAYCRAATPIAGTAPADYDDGLRCAAALVIDNQADREETVA
jgi:hypothetical protein